jgi:hypothetical protein
MGDVGYLGTEMGRGKGLDLTANHKEKRDV